MAKKDMNSLEEQGKRSYFYWHVLLVMKKRVIEKNMLAAGYREPRPSEVQAPVNDSDELTLLQTLRLPLPVDLSPFTLPAPERLSGTRFWFRGDTAFDDGDAFVFDFIRQLSNGKYERCELLRVDQSDSSYVIKVVDKFNFALETNSVSVVFNAAVTWAVFHGAVVLDWLPVASHVIGAKPVINAPSSSSSSDISLSGNESDKLIDSVKRKRRFNRPSGNFFE